MLELFVVGSFWFWALIVVELILLFVFTEYENGICATLSMVAFVAALQFAGNVNVVGALWANWYYVIPLVVSYVLIGAMWSVIKWRILVHANLAKHDEALSSFAVENGLSASTKVLPIQFRAEWNQRVLRSKSYETGLTIADIPQASLHKGKIIKWMSMWPFGVAIFFFKDMTVELFSTAYKTMASFLQRIADNIYAGSNVKANLELPREEPRRDPPQPQS